MSLARAFTTRRAKQPGFELKGSNSPQRNNTTAKRHGYSGSIRNKISGPTELTHTTNMLAYNAPDLYPKSASSVTSSKSSDDESDGHQTSASSPPTSPDVASIDDRSISPEPNHLSCYFTAPGQKLAVGLEEVPVPAIPRRAPSHTKKASYDNLARQQSIRQSSHSGKTVSSKASFSLSRSSSTSTTATSNSSGSYTRNKHLVPSVPEILVEPETTSAPTTRQHFQRDVGGPVAHHPFGQELAQVTEIAEDFGVKDQLRVLDDEEQELERKGLRRFRAEDYLTEVHGLFSAFFTTEPRPMQAQPIWI
ncbi:hypothetical protein BJ170DRAFT_589402 [Xylariales sp. AK1849]|nr:hypothetical protein BJ170DRAFT_589402 [Xylariales sp. AK1849]